MNKYDHRIYDFVIIGSGLGGLLCAYLLAERGHSVCVLEQNVQFGGCLQIFSREKSVFDTGVHYIGELGEGENLNRIFSYFGLMDRLNLEQLDQDGFDVISFRGDPTKYPWAQGHINFVQRLTRLFPDEETAIEKYARTLRSISEDFYSDGFRNLDIDSMNTAAMRTGAKDFIDSLTANEKLRDVLAGNIPTYAGVGDKTPLHQHALIINSYLHSAWRCVDGGAQIAKQLASSIRAMGGVLLRRREIVEINAENGKIRNIVTSEGEVYSGRKFIANIPPEKVLKMLKGVELRKTYTSRLSNQEPTTSFFGLYVRFKSGAFPYYRNNFYHYNQSGVWDATKYDADDWPKSWLFYPAVSSGDGEFMATATVLAYMDFEEMKPWVDTRNTTARPQNRGEAYETFKKQKAERLIDDIEHRFPGFRNSVESYYTSTPLTYRDYLGVVKGAPYGKVKDFHQPHNAFVSPRSKVENLFFTGQHVHLHGIKGVTTTAILTASLILNDPDLFSTILSGKHSKFE